MSESVTMLRYIHTSEVCPTRVQFLGYISRPNWKYICHNEKRHVFIALPVYPEQHARGKSFFIPDKLLQLVACWSPNC